MSLFWVDGFTVVVIVSGILFLVALQARKWQLARRLPEQDAREIMRRGADTSIELRIDRMGKGSESDDSENSDPPPNSKFYLRGPRKTRGEKGVGIARVIRYRRDRYGNPVVRLTNKSGTVFQRLSGDVWDPPAS